jgi:hypothetical protein
MRRCAPRGVAMPLLGHEDVRELLSRHRAELDALERAAADHGALPLPVELANHLGARREHVRLLREHLEQLARGGSPPEYGAGRPPESPSPVKAKRPFVGLGPFSEDDAARFFGREKEADAVADLAVNSRFAVLLGRSGVGKTSLLRCRVVPRLRALGHAVLYLRFDVRDCAAIEDATAAELPAWHDEPHPVSALIRLSRSLGKPLCLIWDQFERLHARGASAARLLAYDVIRRLVATEAGRTSVLLGLREDHAAEVLDLAAHVGCTFTSRSVFRLHSFSAREEVEHIVGRTLALGGVEASAAALGVLSARLCANGSCHPPHLQIYGDYLFRVARCEDVSSVDEALVGSLRAPENVVFERMTQMLDDVIDPIRVSIKRVLEQLVTPWGARRRATRAHLVQMTELPHESLETALRVLEDLHFLVGSDDSGYEIVHDDVAGSLARQLFSEAERQSLLTGEIVRHAYEDWRQHGVHLGASRAQLLLAGHPWRNLRSAAHRAYLFVALRAERRTTSLAQLPELKELSPTITALLDLVASADPRMWLDIAVALPDAVRFSRPAAEPDEPFWEAAGRALESISAHVHAAVTARISILDSVLTAMMAKQDAAADPWPDAIVAMVLSFIEPRRNCLLVLEDRLRHVSGLGIRPELVHMIVVVTGVKGLRALLVSCRGVDQRYEEMIRAAALRVTYRAFLLDVLTDLCADLLEDADRQRRIFGIRLLLQAASVDRERASSLLASKTADGEPSVASVALRCLAEVNDALAVTRSVELLQGVRTRETNPVAKVAFEVVAEHRRLLTAQDIRAIAHHLSEGPTGAPILLSYLDSRLSHDQLAERLTQLGPDLALSFMCRWDSEALVRLLSNHLPLLAAWAAATDTNRWLTARAMASSSVAVQLLIVAVLFGQGDSVLLGTMKLGLATRCRLSGEQRVVAAYCCAACSSGGAPPGEMLDLLLSVLQARFSPYLEACVLMACLSSFTEAQRALLFSILPGRRQKMESEGTWSLSAGMGVLRALHPG